jgi:hypothetical protein
MTTTLCRLATGEVSGGRTRAASGRGDLSGCGRLGR